MLLRYFFSATHASSGILASAFWGMELKRTTLSKKYFFTFIEKAHFSIFPGAARVHGLCRLPTRRL